MTSKNSSSDKTLKIQFRLLRMPAVVTFVIFVIYHIVGAAISFSEAAASYAADVASGTTEASRRADYISSYAENLIGFHAGVGSLLLTFISAALFAVYGYRWLLDRRAVDFYESQPVSRKKRFFTVFGISGCIYAAVYAVTAAAACLIAAGFGGMTGALFVSVLAQFGNSLVLFFAAFAVGSLAVMLTGTVVTSLCAFAVLSSYEAGLTILIRNFFSTYFQTYSDTGGYFQGRLFTTPLYNATQAEGSGILINLVFGAAVLALSYFTYTKRPNEAAGAAVVFRPVRTVVKVAVAFLAGLAFGSLFTYMNSGTALFVTALASFLMACVMEWIYEGDFRKILRHLPATIIATALSVFVLLTFTADLFGYDRWVPSASQVESAAIFTSSDSNCYTDDGDYISTARFARRYMILSDTEDVTEFARECADYKGNDYAGASVTVLYRMKSGRTATRVYSVPAGYDRDILDRITGSEEFRQGTFQIYHDAFTATSGNLEFSYDTDFDVNSAKADYAAFRTAYLKDLENWNLSFVLTHREIGYVTIRNDPNGSEENTFYFSLPVYEGFDSTISFLKDAGLYIEPLSSSDVSRITVAHSVTGGGELVYNDDGTSYYTSDVTETESAEYTDKEQISEILSCAYDQNFSDGPLSGFVTAEAEPDYSISVELPGSDPLTEFYFRKGEVPAFVEQDLK